MVSDEPVCLLHLTNRQLKGKGRSLFAKAAILSFFGTYVVNFCNNHPKAHALNLFIYNFTHPETQKTRYERNYFEAAACLGAAFGTAFLDTAFLVGAAFLGAAFLGLAGVASTQVFCFLALDAVAFLGAAADTALLLLLLFVLDFGGEGGGVRLMGRAFPDEVLVCWPATRSTL